MLRSASQRRRFAAVGGAAALLAVTVACGGSSHTSSSTSSSAPPNSSGSPLTAAPYVIGNIGTYSGSFASSSIGAKDGVDAWVKYTNAHGGINGHPVKLILKDDQLNAALSITEAKQLVSQHVLAIVGVGSIVEDSFAPYLSTQSTAVIGDDLSKNVMGKYKNFFPQGATYVAGYYYGEPKAAALAGAKKFGSIYCAESTACSQIAKAQVGQTGSVGLSFAFKTAASSSAPSYTAQCLTAKGSGADSVALVLNEQVASRVAAACEQQGYHPLWVQGGSGFTQSETTDSALDHVVGAVPVFPWFASSNAAMNEFQSAMRQYEPQDFSSSTANGYSQATANAWASAEIFKAAAMGLTGANPTSQNLIDQLYKLPPNNTFGGLTPPISYVSGAPQPPVNCFFAIELKSHTYSVQKNGTPVCRP